MSDIVNEQNEKKKQLQMHGDSIYLGKWQLIRLHSLITTQVQFA